MSDDDDEPDKEELLSRMIELEMKFNKLAEDFTELRHEMNQIDEKIERRT